MSVHSSHNIDIVAMPGENWRWRMLGAALHVVDKIPLLEKYDGIIVTDLFNLADFNTALVADMVVFNSKMHKDAFLYAMPKFLKKGRDCGPKGIAEKIRKKSDVLYPGITLPFDKDIDAEKQTNPPLIIWNHRWGFDKDCEMFFSALEEIDNLGLAFNLALMGENFGKIPEEFKKAEKKFKNRILQFGYVPLRDEYEKWLKRGAVVISTAIQENFGAFISRNSS